MSSEEVVVTLKEAFDQSFEEVVFDKRLIDRMYRYQVAILNKNDEHLSFFGSNLIGVHSIQFRTSEILKFYNDVCDVNYSGLELAIRKVTTIVHDFAITGDIMNLTLMYMVHRILTSPKLTAAQRERGAYDTALVFFYRCIIIRQSEYFHFPADPKIAQAAYAELSNKFLIKKLGSWRGVMEYRAKDLIDPKGLHRSNLTLFTNDLATVYAISDSENRIRDLYKNYYKTFNEAYESGNRIAISSSTITDVEGVEKIKEKIKSTEQYVNYIRTAILDATGFVRPELVSVIIDINTNTSPRMLTSTLTWLSDSYNTPKWHGKIDEYIRLIVIQSFHLLNECGQSDLKDYASILIALKNLYLSTRSSDRDLLEIRKIGDELIKAANGRINGSLSKATRTATILYITLRAIAVTSKHA